MDGEKLTVILNGKRWTIEFSNLGPSMWGKCNPPDQPNKKIHIHSQIKSQEKLLEVLIHECTHATQWHLDESFVETFARDIARTIVRLARLGIIRLTEET